jgi:hypothetical protein
VTQTADSTKPGFRERVRSSPRAQRRVFVASLGVFALGAVALTTTLFWNTATNKETAISAEAAQVLSPQRKVPISAAAKKVAETWILGAVTRDDLVGTFDLTHADIRGSMSRHEWETGAIPVVPYPVDELYPGRWRVTYSFADEALLEVGLVPSAESQGIKALTFFVGLKKVGTGTKAHWVVNYWSPKYRPPVPLAQ